MDSQNLSVGPYMSDKKPGEFSTTFSCLSLQLKTIFDSVGGDKILPLLDALSNLGEEEKKLLIPAFLAVVNRILAGNERLISEADEERKKFEDSLYNDVMNAMREACGDKKALNRKLEVLDGGKKARRSRTVLDLKSARKKRKIYPVTIN